MESKHIRKMAYRHFETGLHCAEVIYKTTLEIFSEEPDPGMVRIASGFGGGIAGSTEELCGAFTGGVIAIGHFLGRKEPGDDLRDCGAITKKFKEIFEKEFGTLNCKTILKGFDKQENAIGCVKLTATATVLLANLLKELEEDKTFILNDFLAQSRKKVGLGQCPFSAGITQG
jgi:C_GCAxxG_C_C family probable redox protein